MADVFLSYARADKAKAERVKAALEGAGLSVFFDVEGLDGGDVFPDVLDREVKTAGAVVSLWSPHALSRPWVKQECSIGLKRKCLIPLAIEPLGDLDVPVAFEGLQQIDFTGFHGPTDSAEWRKLMRSLARTLGRPDLLAGEAAAPVRAVQAQAQKQAASWPVLLKRIAVFAALIGAVAFGYQVLLPAGDAALVETERVAEGARVAADEPATRLVHEPAPVAIDAPPPAGLTMLQPGVTCSDVEALVYFDFDSTGLTMEGVSILEEALTAGFDCDLLEVRIEAHDDLISSPSYAEGVSKRRADSVADLLVARGVDGALVNRIGFGSSQPLQPGQRSPANRRSVVVFEYEPPGQAQP